MPEHSPNDLQILYALEASARSGAMMWTFAAGMAADPGLRQFFLSMVEPSLDRQHQVQRLIRKLGGTI